MKLIGILTITVAAICTVSPACAGRQFGEGRLVEWLPAYEGLPQSRLPVYAAVGRSILTVVVYDPAALGKMLPEQARFLLLRQDAVAYLAADESRTRGDHDSPWGSPSFSPEGKRAPFTPIEEERLYRHPKLRGLGAAALDCVAFQALDSKEQRALLSTIQSGERVQKAGLVVWPTQRRLTFESTRLLLTSECQEFANSFE